MEGLDKKLTFAIDGRKTAFDRAEDLTNKYNILTVKTNKVSLRLDKALALIDKQRRRKWTDRAVGLGVGVIATTVIVVVIAANN